MIKGYRSMLNGRFSRGWMVGGFAIALWVLSTLVGANLAVAGDVDSIPTEERLAGGDKNKFYFLIGADKKAKPPKSGYRLLLVMPGGNGGKDFLNFVKRIHLNVLSKEYLVAELVAPKWTEDQFSRLVWPTDKKRWQKMRFSTEKFVEAVVADVKKEYPVDARYVFTLGWSSGGPPSYAVSLADGTSITGSYIAQSVFHRGSLPSLRKARGRAYFLDHSPQDQTCPYKQALLAEKLLKKSGAKVKLVTYEGGHGWKGPVYNRLREGIRFLEKNRRILRRKR